MITIHNGNTQDDADEGSENGLPGDLSCSRSNIDMVVLFCFFLHPEMIACFYSGIISAMLICIADMYLFLKLNYTNHH